MIRLPLFASWTFALLLAFCISPPTFGLLEDEAGLNDFLVATTGHGLGTRVIYSAQDSVVTTGTASPCWIASRSISTGSLQWRRNICADESLADVSAHTTTVGGRFLVTATSEGVVRCWTLADGVLVWDAPPTTGAEMRLWGVSTGKNLVASASSTDESLTIRNAANGRVLSTVAMADVKKGSSWLHVMTSPLDDSTLLGLIGTVKDEIVSGSSLMLVDMKLVDDGLNVGKPASLSRSSADFLASSLVLQSMPGDEWHGLALSPDKSQVVQFSVLGSPSVRQVVDLPQFHALWTSMERLETTTEPGLIRIQGQDNRYVPPRDSTALFRFEPSDQLWDQWYGVQGEEETEFDAIAFCPVASLVVSLSFGESKFEAFSVGEASLTSGEGSAVTRTQRHRLLSPLHAVSVTGDDNLIPKTDSVIGFTVIHCDADSMSALLTTSLGTTMQLTFAKTSADGVGVSIAWSQEEGLSSVSSAFLLDASHHSLPVLDTISEEEQLATLQNLTFASRLKLQVDDLKSMILRTGTPTSRDHDFGFVKVAVLLSSSAHRVWGMLTSGNTRGSVSWKVDLPAAAEWHTLVHGTSSSTAGVHAMNIGAHSPEILLLSSIPQADGTVEIAWTCMEGTTGAIHSSGSIAALASVTQVLPVHGGGACQQGALLLDKNGAVHVVPDGEKTLSAISDHIGSHRNGMYAHAINRDQAALESYQISANGASFTTIPVGRTAFPGESIVTVSYPQREDVVQSPSTVLGDDSLLLKYLNPHLVVVVTMAKETETGDFATALSKKSKRKPKGVTQPGDDPKTATPVQSEDNPNLFVNVMDTVSGRVLYRASHSNAQAGQDVPVIVSENWVIYAFFSEKTRRTELGVLSLYEGMIDKNGLTAFTSPEQAMSFSSMEARDSKPVVLTKTYGLSKPVTALGITLTRGGISTKHVLFATGDDKIMSLSRQVLEPRRPTGSVKESEKIEGLYQYHPLLNFIPQWSPSYNQTVHGTKIVLSAPAALESQSLILAVGGPDIFFTRMSPSKGFDLLPESFNRPLLALIVVGILGVLSVVRGMSQKKIVNTGWS